MWASCLRFRVFLMIRYSAWVSLLCTDAKCDCTEDLVQRPRCQVGSGQCLQGCFSRFSPV